MRALVEQHQYADAYDALRSEEFMPYEELWCAFESIPEIAEEKDRHRRIQGRNYGEDEKYTERCLKEWRAQIVETLSAFVSGMTVADLVRLERLAS